jgi:hypothetical protein
MESPPVGGGTFERLRVVAVAVWLGAVIGGTALVWRYKQTPGEHGSTPTTWPSSTLVALSPTKPTLVLLAHPRCPCTRASLSELRTLVSALHGRADVHVVFVQPEGTDDSFMQSDVFESAKSIDGVDVRIDKGGHDVTRFGALVSGHTVLYGPKGNLLFSGGITSARAHEGDNAGVDAIVAIVTRGASTGKETPVYGCELFDDEKVAQNTLGASR